MLLALIQDLLRIPGVSVVTTWDRRLDAFPLSEGSACDVVLTSSPIDEQDSFQRLCSESDAAFVIAPEFHGILAFRVQTASSRTRLIGCDSAATALCSDKLRLGGFLVAKGIPTVPTEKFDPACGALTSSESDSAFPCVIKPRDGAGSLLTFRVSTRTELAERSKQILSENQTFEFVRQPFIEGTAVSCAAIVSAGTDHSRNTPVIDVLPPCEQVLSTDGCFRYEGATFPVRPHQQVPDPTPAESEDPFSAPFPQKLESTHVSPPAPGHALCRGKNVADVERLQGLVRHCCSLIPGLCGYVGFDLLLPHDKNAEPVVVEINPRLTTGFLLWQQLCSDNLVARMLEIDTSSKRPPLSWKRDAHSIRIRSLQK